MTKAQLVCALRRITPDELNCFGCGHEHNCSSEGCAVTLKAARTIESLTEQLKAAEAERDALARRMIESERAQGGGGLQ